MYAFQYLAGAALCLAVSTYITIKERGSRSFAVKNLVLFGLVGVVWELSSFFYRTAPNSAESLKFFRVMGICTHIGYPVYLLTFLSVHRPLSKRTLMLVGSSIIVETLMFLHPEYATAFEFRLTESGWHYVMTSFNLPLAIDTIIFMGYIAAIIVGLYTLIRKTNATLLRKKYIIFLVSFVSFQILGILMTNALIAYELLNPVLQIGGIFQFLTFLMIWYALSLEQTRIQVPLAGQDFSQIYSSFLTAFYGSVIASRLGEEVHRFTDFIKRSKIQENISIANNVITFEEREDVNLAKLINRNLEMFEKDSLYDEAVDSYLRVLNAADQKLGWKFDEVVKANEDFLKRSDLIYGISKGRFLEEIAKDESLRHLDDVEACLKIYKRILLQTMSRIQEKAEFQKKLAEHYVTSAIRITDYREILMNGVKDRLLSIPKDQRLTFIIERFNQLVSSAYETILADRDTDIEEVLRKLRVVLALNKDKAVSLGIYPTLLGTLATKIPRTQVHRLYSDYLEELVEERTEELKKTQRELLKSQRLAAIGEVAAMVGHDLRNPLQSIVNMMYLAKEKLNSTPLQGSELLKLAETVEEQVRYMNKIVSDLEDYARPLKVELAPTDLHKLINETLSNIKVPDTVEVSVMIEDDLDFPKLIVDAALMKRVFINLITNALQAMPDGGHLKIVAKRTEDSALISIQDTGVGIPEENTDKIFQPLFSTKAKGQGLGLPVCKRLVEAHNGSITFKSKAGKGSTFTVEIPLQYMAGRQKEPKIIPRAA